MKHLMILTRGFFESPAGVNSTKPAFMSEAFSADVIYMVYDRQYKKYDLGGFWLLGCYIPKIIRISRLVSSIYYSLQVFAKSIYRHWFVKRYSAIVSINPISSGVLGWLISRFLRVVFVVEVNGNYASAYVWHEGKENLAATLKHRVALALVPFVLNRADAVKLLYPDQLHPYGRNIDLKREPFVFHEFTQVSTFQLSGHDEGYVLFIGAPWYIKGVDLLIDAFAKVARRFPDAKLKIVGWFPGDDERILKNLAQGISQIEICKPVFYAEAQRLIDRCSFFVLPSRTEGMGRVLLEAMAHKKALIGSNVDGIPHYVKDGFNGMLFNSGNSDMLAEKIIYLYENSDKRRELAENGFRYVRECLSEEKYVRHYADMLSGLM